MTGRIALLHACCNERFDARADTDQKDPDLGMHPCTTLLSHRTGWVQANTKPPSNSLDQSQANVDLYDRLYEGSDTAMATTAELRTLVAHLLSRAEAVGPSPNRWGAGSLAIWVLECV